MLRRLYPVVFLFSAPVAAQDITLTDGQSVTVSNGQVIDGIDGDINNVTGATITIEAGGVVTGFDAFELGDTTDVTVIVYGTIDSADGGVVGTIYSNPPGNTASGDDAIVAWDATRLTIVLKDGALVLADDEFINGGSSTTATITLENGSKVYAVDEGIDNLGASTITIDGYLEVGDSINTGADGIDVANSTITIGATGEIIASGDGLWVDGANGNIIQIFGRITGGDDAVDAAADNNIVVGSTGHLIATDNGIEAEDDNVVRIWGRISSNDHGIDLGSNTSSNTGGNVVTIYSGAVVRADDRGIQFDNSGNTLQLHGTVIGDNDAISAVGGDNTITVNEGAILIGNLASGANTSGNTLRFDVGSAQSYVFATTGSWTLEDLDGRAVVEGSAMAAGIGNVETADEMMFDRAFGLDGSLARLERQATTGERQALFDAYGFSRSSDENGTTAAYELDSRGMTIGMPLDLLGHEAIAFVNYHDSEIDIASGTHDIDAQSVRFGLSIPKMWSGENYDIGLYAVAGRNSYDGTRDVLVNQNTTTGITTVDASWDGTELELGVDTSMRNAVSERLSIDSSLGLAAQVERVGSYSEQNYFAWDSRTIVQVHAKAELTLGYQASNSTRLYGTAGAWRRDVQSGETASYTINNTAVSYNGGVYYDTITSLRFGVGHSLSNGAVVSAEAMALDSRNADSSWGASIGIAARF